MEYIIDSKSLNKCKELKSKEVNLLPCNIEYSGPAEVDSYFIIKDTDEVNNNDQKVYISAFRGRGLKGVESNTTNYTGYVLKKCNVEDFPNEKFENSVKKVFKAEKKFNSFMIWNHDYTPTFDNNPCLKSLAWLEVASAINESS
ncbi:ribonuclease H1 small subunit [Neocallimastix lanati (nom. inval.)]|uniref:Ribonuclease H1 small subunit n=1 Tax=Neocallimastix californiae TaxID=1754190 RepID=A0A1Y2DME8_9FUNG|nr:ribonuclease H1 small subunit [Neocallimastix sp. JGI-2020a]ORY60437.1 ribonuclease H1 small subunit [Neocallimastix californiae]|eukprot:ORY60437.1 ribonuclease H1 small subunit [Neocallimastix californiae]